MESAELEMVTEENPPDMEATGTVVAAAKETQMVAVAAAAAVAAMPVAEGVL